MILSLNWQRLHIFCLEPQWNLPAQEPRRALEEFHEIHGYGSPSRVIQAVIRRCRPHRLPPAFGTALELRGVHLGPALAVPVACQPPLHGRLRGCAPAAASRLPPTVGFSGFSSSPAGGAACGDTAASGPLGCVARIRGESAATAP